MSVPVSIHQCRGDSPQVHTPHTGVFGTSPGSGRTDKHQSTSSQAARKLLRRIQWDESLDEKEWTVRHGNPCNALAYAQLLALCSIKGRILGIPFEMVPQQQSLLH